MTRGGGRQARLWVPFLTPVPGPGHRPRDRGPAGPGGNAFGSVLGHPAIIQHDVYNSISRIQNVIKKICENKVKIGRTPFMLILPSIVVDR